MDRHTDSTRLLYCRVVYVFVYTALEFPLCFFLPFCLAPSFPVARLGSVLVAIWKP